MQDLMIALQQGYVNGTDAIELLLESCKKAIPTFQAELELYVGMRS